MAQQIHATGKEGRVLTLGYARRQVKAALREFFRDHAKLLWLDAGERCLAHQFAMYLAPLFPQDDVDCEYNRDGHRMREHDGTPSKLAKLFAKRGIQLIYPDVIVHKRARPVNRLVTEVKRTMNLDGAERRKDEIKLEFFTAPHIDYIGTAFHYDVGLFLDLRTGRHVYDTGMLLALATWYIDGKRYNDEPEELEPTQTKEPRW